MMKTNKVLKLDETLVAKELRDVNKLKGSLSSFATEYVKEVFGIETKFTIRFLSNRGNIASIPVDGTPVISVDRQYAYCCQKLEIMENVFNAIKHECIHFGLISLGIKGFRDGEAPFENTLGYLDVPSSIIVENSEHNLMGLNLMIDLDFNTEDGTNVMTKEKDFSLDLLKPNKILMNIANGFAIINTKANVYIEQHTK